MFRGEVAITEVMVSLLCYTMLYKAEYYSQRGALLSQLSSQNYICDPSLVEKVLNQKKNLFVAISPAQKCESLVVLC
jgi:hypothetical protein